MKISKSKQFHSVNNSNKMHIPKMPTLNKYLFFFELEVCGYLVGWLGSIISSVGIILVIAGGAIILTDFKKYGDSWRDSDIKINFVIDWGIDKMMEYKAGKFKS